MPKFLYYPTKPFFITQAFGMNPQTYAQFGIKGHNGLDIRAFHGQPVYASHDGTAYFETDGSQGEGVVIVSNEPFSYDRTLTQFTNDQTKPKVYCKTIYWHFCDEKKDPKFMSPVLKYQRANHGKGMPVLAGDIVGYADNTGFSTGDHLHFGLKPVVNGTGDPQDATDEGIGAWVNVSPNNGFLGAINPLPYLSETHAVDIPIIIEKQKEVISIMQTLLNYLKERWSNFNH